MQLKKVIPILIPISLAIRKIEIPADKNRIEANLNGGNSVTAILLSK